VLCSDQADIYWWLAEYSAVDKTFEEIQTNALSSLSFGEQQYGFTTTNSYNMKQLEIQVHPYRTYKFIAYC
jgi:hypothetical protein